MMFVHRKCIGNLLYIHFITPGFIFVHTARHFYKIVNRHIIARYIHFISLCQLSYSELLH